MSTEDESEGPVIVGIAWYQSKADFDHMKKVAADPEMWEEDYEQWQQLALEKEQALIRSGYTPMRVAITAEGLAAWCRRQGWLKMDARARSKYVTELLNERFG
jgi:hypothetical protein